MIATLIALLAAHILADFVLQTDWMVREKRRPMVQLLHGAIVLGTAMLFTGQIIPGKRLIALALSHLIIDAIKIYATRGGLAAFLVDQSAHLVALSLVALWSQDLWATGIWVTGFGPVGLPGILLPPEVQNALLHGMVLISGAILAIRAGKFALKMLMDGQQKKHPPAPQPVTRLIRACPMVAR